MSESDESLDWQSWEKLPYLLSFVTDDSGRYLAIHADLNGVSALIDALRELREQLVRDDCPHTHLSPGRGYGPYLTATMLADQRDEANAVQHVKIYGWNEEWAVRHELRPPAPPTQDRGWSM